MLVLIPGQEVSVDVGVDTWSGFEDLTDTGLDLGVLACMGLYLKEPGLKELAYMGGDLTLESSTSDKSSGESERERLSNESPNSDSSQDPIMNMLEEDISPNGIFGCDTSTDDIFTVDVIV